MKTPRVSVVMAVYNDERFVAEAIESVLGQTYGDLELIVVDDASTDSSPGIVSRFDDRRMHVVRNARNVGLTRALNVGLEKARGEYIARIDSDDVALPTRIEKQLDHLDAHERIGMLGTQDLRINEDGDEVDFRKKPTSPGELRRLLMTGANPFRHSSAVFRRRIIDRVGPYRAELQMAQDYDLWLRIAEIADVANLPEPLCKYRVRADSMTYAKSARQADDADFAHRLAIQRHVFGRDELGYAPDAEPFVALRDELSRGFLARKSALSDRYLLCGREMPFRHGRWRRRLTTQYLLQSLYNNPLNGDTWRYIVGKALSRPAQRRERHS